MAIESLEKSYRDAIGSLSEEPSTIQRPRGQITSEPLTLGEPERPGRIEPADRTERPIRSARTAPAAPLNIWDLEESATGRDLPPAAAMPEPKTELPPAPTPSPAPAAAPSAAAARPTARSRRTKTRLIGFEKSDGAVVDLFNDSSEATPTPAAPAKSVKFPVGWLVVAEGPGRGESFALQTGMSQIGRGADQAVQLDFGDNSISRSNHAAIVYDPETKEFLLGHGGKSNIVRLNNKPVISNESLKTGDTIKIGETVLRFVALCGKSFSWAEGASGEDEDVAIA